MTSLIKAIYWRLRIVHLSLRWVRGFNLGDAVIYQGREWRLSQGVKSPVWTLRDGQDAVEAHEKDFVKVRSLANYLGSFQSGYRFYMGYWYGIWKRDGIQPWMRSRKIMG